MFRGKSEPLFIKLFLYCKKQCKCACHLNQVPKKSITTLHRNFACDKHTAETSVYFTRQNNVGHTLIFLYTLIFFIAFCRRKRENVCRIKIFVTSKYFVYNIILSDYLSDKRKPRKADTLFSVPIVPATIRVLIIFSNG